MPIYEFYCKKCKKHFEEIMKFSEMKESSRCDSCGSKSARVLSESSFRLNGSGWAADGYCKDKKK